VITSIISDKCVTMPEGANNEGWTAVIWQCYAGQASQVYATTPVNSSAGGTSQMKTSSGFCFDTNGYGQYTSTLTQFTCSGGPSQRFQFLKQSDGTYMLRTPDNAMCMTVAGGGTADGTQMIPAACTGATNQKFNVR
jgi:hypothetical protein